jgi:hypothetical protein
MTVAVHRRRPVVDRHIARGVIHHHLTAVGLLVLFIRIRRHRHPLLARIKEIVVVDAWIRVMMILEAPIHPIRRRSPRILVIANLKSQRPNRDVDTVVMKHTMPTF